MFFFLISFQALFNYLNIKLMKRIKLLYLSFLVLVVTSVLLTGNQLFAQASVCPEYTEFFAYTTRIKFCPGGGGFITWEDCVFNPSEICPCPMVHEQPCPREN